ncbi:MAG: hypothetical protein E2576_14620 [Alcaligenaceae bacterium]|nr:hypothetical protein [Alcaligenaceae bacterium SAGV5]MPS53627.1 hypothetical protein [Alcaligenaceae bacterium SAGV3]MPT57952.1 hypothetical protein [Alcaligenaceae bacterium]
MSVQAARLSRCAVILGVTGALLASVPAQAADQAAPAASVIEFDIPALPLADALDRFAVVSGRSALFSSTLAAGRTASPVRGRYRSVDALHLLLEGTGLAAEEVATAQADALVIRPASPKERADAEAARIAARANLLAYDGLLQARVWQALCADPRTMRHDDQSLLRFEVDATGHVHRVRLLGATGDRRRDAALVEVVAGVRVGRAPPPELAQPVTLLILPPHESAPACDAGAV